MVRTLSIPILLAIPVSLPAPMHAAPSGPLDEHARHFLGTLDTDQREDATWPFDDGERRDVHYAPLNLDGLRHGDLEGASFQAGEALLAAALSTPGFERLSAIRLLERDVHASDSIFVRPLGLRDPGRYFFALFGTPDATSPWAFRYEGHHLSVNVTAMPGSPPVSTPLFLGAQPRVVPPGMPSAGVAALGEEEALARTLYASLDEAGRTRATLAYAPDRGHMIGQVAALDPPTPIGLPRAAMTPEQQQVLDRLLEQFAGFWNAEIAAARRAELEASRAEQHFAFVAADDPPNAFYMRVSGPGLLIEIDNTEGGDHVHAVWHRPGADFGDDLLARHLRTAHGVTMVRH
jgi:hypothetical protein